MYILTLPEHFQKLKDISEDVANYIDSEAYIADFGPDDYTPKSLLVNCYDVIVGELEDMGITTDLQYQGIYFYAVICIWSVSTWMISNFF